MTVWIGVDVGGTFTDVIAFDDASGRRLTHKLPSTPQNPAQAILAGLKAIQENGGVRLVDIAQIAHGTTVGTNALIERKGSRVALITTRGFRDVIEIGRQTRPGHFDMYRDHPPPVAPRWRRFEIAERVLADGSVHIELTDEEIARVVAEALASGAEAIAVSLLFSYLNPDHERRIALAIERAAPGAYVSISSEVHPEFREYERTSTTTLNAYLQPKLARYLGDLGAGIAAEIGDVDVVISHSAGGLMSLGAARRFPIRTALSGPAAGVLGAMEVAAQAGFRNIVTFDVGGTSADVALIQDLQPGQSRAKEVGGWPIRLPAIDISTIGAGGGSIAFFDRDGGLRVGPRSAGAYPGPACYGFGGMEPTVTDANLVLGRLSPGGLLDGRLDLDIAAARRAFEPIAQRLGFTIERTAYGVIEIVVANMARVIRTVSVEQGFDPRELALLAYGGAGPLHARAVAASLEIGTLIVPTMPGLLCAAGLIASPLKEDFLRTARIRLDDPAASVRVDVVLAELHGLACAWIDAERIRPDTAALRIVLDLRYVGQNFELEVVLPDPGLGAVPHAPDGKTLRDRFFEQHDKTYGFHNPDAPVEIVNCRIAATGSRHPPAQASAMAVGGKPANPVGSRSVWFDGTAPTAAAVYRREQLARGQTLEGPAVIEQMDTTTIVMRGDRLRVDDFGNLAIEIGR
jgi:N-methylhydantoinase A